MYECVGPRRCVRFVRLDGMEVVDGWSLPNQGKSGVERMLQVCTCMQACSRRAGEQRGGGVAIVLLER